MAGTSAKTFRRFAFRFSERFAIHKAYEGVCIYCREYVPFPDFEVDHIICQSLLAEPDRLGSLCSDYGLNNFSLNSFANWACSHRACNRSKADTTFDKSRALHYLLVADKKARTAESIFRALEKKKNVDKVLAPLRVHMENGLISHSDLLDFANTVIRNADVGLNNPTVLCFGLLMGEAYANLPSGAPRSIPDLYDWLENDLTRKLAGQLDREIQLIESGRDGETLSVRYAIWDIDIDELDRLEIECWKLLEISLHTHIYGDFFP